MKRSLFLILIIALLLSCSGNDKSNQRQTQDTPLFTKIDALHSNIDFKNTVKENNYFNFLNYSYIYNGGGVAIGDINNDGLSDLYFTSNQTPNKLYLNEGSFKFKDISTNAKVEDDTEGWTTGVTMIDINNDGFLDIYVCKSGLFNDKKLRTNKLYINQRNNTFKEESEKYGLNDTGFSTQAYFFDFDKDEDLDMYLVNHRPDFNNNAVINLEFQKKIFRDGSDQLYRNDNGKFTNISEVAGILNKAWGLSASVGDFNNDNWPDIYVANDFLEPDFLYINNKNGTFTDQLQESFNHISSNSMGSDYADLNNDLHPDLLVLDMSPEDHVRSKQNMPSMSTANFNHIVNSGYHHQYMQNTLQLNNGNNTYSEIALMAGLAKTDWSWAPLIADFDNDGLKDVFVTNGVLHELNNQDFREKIKLKISKKEKMDLAEAINMMPSEKTNNYIFKNNGDLTFKKKSKEWGLDDKTYSNGAAYADLDNDGDLDLVVNNIDDQVGLYRNNQEGNFIQLKLNGSEKNPFGIGAEVTLKHSGNQQLQWLYPSRGFQSSVDSKLNFGLGEDTKIDSIIVEWPNGSKSIRTNQTANQILEINFSNAINEIESSSNNNFFLEEVSAEELGISYEHKENEFDDFKNQILLPHSESKNGPFIAQSDVNNDGLTDFFIGGAKGQSGELYLQKKHGGFIKKNNSAFLKDKEYEDLGVLFFDANLDGNDDLYIVSGGTEHPHLNKMYQDRLYLNDGSGKFARSKNSLPTINTSGQVVTSSDVDNDGDLDLFIGGRIIPDKYPYSPKSYLLINENGIFKNATDDQAIDFNKMGLITDALFSDFDNDGDDDLIAVGEWTKIQIFENNNGFFSKKEIPDLKKTSGLWFSIAQKDMDGDGDPDYFIGNLGLNSKFKAKPNLPFQIFCDDFDQNGTFDIILTNNYKGELVPLRGKECTTQQIPSLNEKFPTFNEFANANISSIFGEQNLEKALNLSADIFYSVYLENLGNGNFNIVKLPNSVQSSPILDFEFVDINNNGKEEIVITGNLYDTEVETVRYDASYGHVLKYNNTEFSNIHYQETGFSIKGNVKDMTKLKMKDSIYLIAVKNNGKPSFYKD